jgi:hypothetical protein
VLLILCAFRNIYRKGSTNTPLGVYRYAYEKKIYLSTNNSLKLDTWYTVKVTTGMTDGANNLAAPYKWSF